MSANMRLETSSIRTFFYQSERCKEVEKRYIYRKFDRFVDVIFPGDVVHKCSLPDIEKFKEDVIPTPCSDKMVLVSRSFFNRFSPKSIIGVEDRYSSTWECVMDPRKYSESDELAWAMKGIDYEALGFKASTIQGCLGTYRIWLANHHYQYKKEVETVLLYDKYSFQGY
jgi:hypothetical protein